MSAVRAEGEPERVVPTALVYIGLDLAPSRSPVGVHAMETVGQDVRALGPEDRHRWEPGPCLECFDVFADRALADFRADLRPGTGHQLLERQRLSGGGLSRPLRRQSSLR